MGYLTLQQPEFLAGLRIKGSAPLVFLVHLDLKTSLSNPTLTHKISHGGGGVVGAECNHLIGWCRSCN